MLVPPPPPERDRCSRAGSDSLDSSGLGVARGRDDDAGDGCSPDSCEGAAELDGGGGTWEGRPSTDCGDDGVLCASGLCITPTQGEAHAKGQAQTAVLRSKKLLTTSSSSRYAPCRPCASVLAAAPSDTIDTLQ